MYNARAPKLILNKEGQISTRGATFYDNGYDSRPCPSGFGFKWRD